LMDPIQLNYGNLISPRITLGVSSEDLDGVIGERFKEVMAAVDARRSAGDFGFFELPSSPANSKHVITLAESFRQHFSDVVVLGIGGSGLGARTLRDALLGPDWNNRSGEERDHYPRLHVLDNPDPDTLGALFSRMDPTKTLFNVISKSGKTVETLAQYLVARDWVASSVGEENALRHFIFTTDPNYGPLRHIAETEGVLTLPFPENVSGRFSILSAAGLLPVALCGVDIEALLRGAALMDDRCRIDKLKENPGGILASLLYEAHIKHGQKIHVLMPYADRLTSTSEWFQQLWAESLGKHHSMDGEEKATGPTPLVALGARDQHSLLQLFMEGPRDKVVLFVTVEDHGSEVTIPDRHQDLKEELSYLGGHTMGQLLTAEWRATAEALRRAACPNATIHLPAVRADTMGQLLMLLEVTTVIVAELYGVDPLGQPGVELGKRLTYDLMNQKGSGKPDIDESDLQWLI
jgi:glucose-6-phosphate isomerase